jgi:hypothetical protein
MLQDLPLDAQAARAKENKDASRGKRKEERSKGATKASSNTLDLAF